MKKFAALLALVLVLVITASVAMALSVTAEYYEETNTLRITATGVDFPKEIWIDNGNTGLAFLKDGSKDFTMKLENGTHTVKLNGHPSATCKFTVGAVPTATPTAVPTATPTAVPTATPTVAPTAAPTAVPTAVPTATPTVAPTVAPTAEPTAAPTGELTLVSAYYEGNKIKYFVSGLTYYCEVWLDNVNTGTSIHTNGSHTYNKSLNVGKHTLTLHDPSKNKTVNFQFEVKAVAPSVSATYEPGILKLTISNLVNMCEVWVDGVNTGRSVDKNGTVSVPYTLTEGNHTIVLHDPFVNMNGSASLTVGHYGKVVPGYAPACEKTGLTDGEVCVICGKTLVAQVTIPALDHKPGAVVKENEVAPTCVKTGSYDNVQYCTVCKAEVSRKAQTVPALGHKPGTVVKENEVAPTCEKTGSYDNVQYCTVCKAELSRKAETIPALGHDMSAFAVTTEPTCTKEGVATSKCSRCDKTETKAVEMIDHVPGEAVKENVVDPTCEEEGTYDEVVYCTACKTELSREAKKVDALGHTAGEPVVTDATCEEAGSSVISCTVCQKELENVEIPALGHTAGEPVVTDATCEEAGSIVTSCTVCEKVLETEVLPALGHTESEVVTVKAPTCTEDGVGMIGCTVCEKVLEENIVLPALGHKAGPIVKENKVDPTCVKDGSYDNAQYCTVCKAEVARETVPVAALGHKLGDWTLTTAPTCTEKGVETKFCSACDYTETRDVDMIAHVAGDWEVSKVMTDEEDGEEVQKCVACGKVLNSRVIDAKGHTPGEMVVVTEATCTTDGEGVIKCVDDGKVLETITLPATGHEWNDGVVTTEPTCVVEGVKTFTCEKCGETRTESVAMIAHNYIWKVKKYPSEIADGLCQLICTGCGQVKDSFVLKYPSADDELSENIPMITEGVAVIDLNDKCTMIGNALIVDLTENNSYIFKLLAGDKIIGCVLVDVNDGITVTLVPFDGITVTEVKAVLFGSAADMEGEGTEIVLEEKMTVEGNVAIIVINGVVDGQISSFDDFVVDEELVKAMMELLA